ncbi:MAG TPA: MarR family transcriptional regulator [Candidatus Dormibacteraeota bacterium]|nr:MarR family transcriptional regulator [Candidatus Dormibacteraeota bacterium]
MESRSRASQVFHALRRVNLEGSVFGQTVAIRFGLSESDIEALERLAEVGTTTAGRLGDLMGLSSGAVTRVLDRLGQSGFVRRTADPADRRRVIVELVPEKAASIDSLTERLARASEAELARYTADQLDAIADFLGRMSQVTRDQTEALRGGAAGDPDGTETEGGEHAAPLGGLTSARFHLRGGASELTLRGAPGPMPDLYRAEFTGPVPQVRLRNGVVSVQYRGGRPWDWRRRTSLFSLNPTVAWEVSLTGGASRIAVDAASLDLRSLELSGGVDRLTMALARPRGETEIRRSGGAHDVTLERPAGVRVLVQVSGGAARLDLDGRRTVAAGSVELATGGTDGTADRIAVRISGGVAGLTVAETAVKG